MRVRRIALSVFFSMAMLGAASAAPAQHQNGLTVPSAIVHVQHNRHHGAPHGRPAIRPAPGYRGGPHPHYRPGHRYSSAPRGWHRYHARPRDWRNRGCVIVGPVWFCP